MIKLTCAGVVRSLMASEYFFATYFTISETTTRLTESGKSRNIFLSLEAIKRIKNRTTFVTF